MKFDSQDSILMTKIINILIDQILAVQFGITFLQMSIKFSSIQQLQLQWNFSDFKENQIQIQQWRIFQLTFYSQMTKKLITNSLNHSQNLPKVSAPNAVDPQDAEKDCSVPVSCSGMKPQSQYIQKNPTKNIDSKKKAQNLQKTETKDIKKKSIRKTKKPYQKQIVSNEKQTQKEKRVRNRISNKWREKAQQKMRLKLLERGFQGLNKEEFLQTDLTQFTLILDDEDFYGQQIRYSGEYNQFTTISYARPQQEIINYMNDEFPIKKKWFKVLSINMDLGKPQKFKTYQGSDNYTRTRDFIDYLNRSYNDGFDFVFIQQLALYKNCKMVYDALRIGEVPYFYAKNMLPKLPQQWQEATHCCYDTIVLSRYPVKFGDYKENISLVHNAKTQTCNKTFRFLQFKILIKSEEKIVRMLSTHLKANTKLNFDKPTIDYQFIRDKEIELLDQYSSNCDILLAIGDANIGTNERYYLKGNLKLRQHFVDFLDLDCLRQKFEADADGTRYGTYMWQEDGIFSMDRFDRALIKIKHQTQQHTKASVLAHVETENPQLTAVRGFGLDREQIMMARLDHCNFINLSDHSALKCVFGFKNLA